MEKVIEISLGGKKVFSIEEARRLLPIIRRCTEQSYQRALTLNKEKEKLSFFQLNKARDLDAQIETVFAQWETKIRKLGAEPRGVWIADFDSGDGYFCWKYPEPEILYWHRYDDGFSKRVSVQMKLQGRTHENCSLPN